MAKNIETLEDLTPDPFNANDGTLRGAQLVDHSFSNHGAGRPIVVDKNGIIIAGNKTHERAHEGGHAVRVVRTNGEKLVVVQREDLDLKTDPGARELAYLDNRAAEVGLSWNAEQMAADLTRGISLGSMFTATELEETLQKSIDPDWGWLPAAEAGAKTQEALTTTVNFDNGVQFRQWLAFVSHLEQKYPDLPSIAARIDAWITDHPEGANG